METTILYRVILDYTTHNIASRYPPLSGLEGVATQVAHTANTKPPFRLYGSRISRGCYTQVLAASTCVCSVKKNCQIVSNSRKMRDEAGRLGIQAVLISKIRPKARAGKGMGGLHQMICEKKHATTLTTGFGKFATRKTPKIRSPPRGPGRL